MRPANGTLLAAFVVTCLILIPSLWAVAAVAWKTFVVSSYVAAAERKISTFFERKRGSEGLDGNEEESE